MQTRASLVWFRRDLRLDDHAALYHALKVSDAVYCAFVFDRTILDPLPRADRRVAFILESVRELDAALRAKGGVLLCLTGDPRDEIPRLASRLGVQTVWTNRDYEPAVIARDAQVAERLAAQGIGFETAKDQVIFEQDEVLTADGRPFSVFTPYQRAWRKRLTPFYLRPYPVQRYLDRLARTDGDSLPTLAALGFDTVDVSRLQPGMSGAETLLADFSHRIDRYHEARDYPAVKGPSYLSVHLRFGTVSIRQLAGFAEHLGNAGADTWLNELIWRDFYQQILWHHPRVVDHAFKPVFDALVFENRQDWFAAWCEGRTGYPLVDAAMRQLNQSGYMHNRLRMVTASFLVKDLLIDWRWGERYFAEKLIDYDLAANNGGWQWAAGTGCDAQPYFRIFNPVSQSEKFDPKGAFIRRYVPELADLPDRAIHAPWQASPIELSAAGIRLGDHYPAPLVDHAIQRERALAMFNRVKGA